MSNRHYEVNEEVEITIKVKVNIKSCSDYRYLKEDELKEEVRHVKMQMEDYLVSQITGEYDSEEICDGMDYWTFEVESI